MKKYIFCLVIIIGWRCSKVSESKRKEVKLVFVLNIIDDEKYKQYRDFISPLITKYEVKISNEYEISKVLHSQQSTEQVNRIAMFVFPSRKVKQKFFSDEVYKNAKKLFLASTKNFKKIIE